MEAVSLVIQRLKDESAGWKDVRGLLDLADLKNQQLNRTPVLFVINLQEHASTDVRSSGPPLQTIRQTLGVILVEQFHNDTPDLQPMRLAVRRKLFGWTPEGFESMTLAGGRLLSLEKGQVAWIDLFTTEYTEDANSL